MKKREIGGGKRTQRKRKLDKRAKRKIVQKSRKKEKSERD